MSVRVIGANVHISLDHSPWSVSVRIAQRGGAAGTCWSGDRRAIRDGATLEVHYLRDKVPFEVDEEALSAGVEEICAEMECSTVHDEDTRSNRRPLV